MTTQKNPYPRAERGLRACITITRRGVKVYGNKAAFRTLARWMEWLAAADESEHFSFPLLWHLSAPFASKQKVFVLADEQMRSVFGEGQQELVNSFEITFMAVENADLEALRDHEEAGSLPIDWDSESE